MKTIILKLHSTTYQSLSLKEESMTTNYTWLWYRSIQQCEFKPFLIWPYFTNFTNRVSVGNLWPLSQIWTIACVRHHQLNMFFIDKHLQWILVVKHINFEPQLSEMLPFVYPKFHSSHQQTCITKKYTQLLHCGF